MIEFIIDIVCLTKRGFLMIQGMEARSDWYSLINSLAGFFILGYNFFCVMKKRKVMGGISLCFLNRVSRVEKQNRFVKFITDTTFLCFFQTLLFVVSQFIPSIFVQYFREWFDTGANYFGLIFTAPIIMTAFCFLFWINPIKQIDLSTPAFPISLAVTKIACAGAGCCHGMAWNYGVMNYKYERCEVPIQIIECLVAFLIFVFLIFYSKKAKPGTVYPLFVILFSGTRFFTEFLRGEDNLWGPFKKYHLFCFIGVIYGIILLVAALKFGDKFTKLFEESTYFTKGRFHQNVVELRNTIESKETKKQAERKKQAYQKPNKKKIRK